jgi:hypothetical protein
VETRHTTKPVCKLTGTDGNVFFLAARVGKALKKAGQADKADEMYERLRTCPSYDASLQLFMAYVDVR